MKTVEIERKKITLDLAEMIWRNKIRSHIFENLRDNKFIGCNAEDQALLSDIIELINEGNNIGNYYLHWIPKNVNNFVVQPENSNILYIMRPEIMHNIFNIITQNNNNNITVEYNLDVALVYIKNK